MDNQIVKIGLGIALLSIWGLLGYRVYSKMFPDEDIIANNFTQKVSVRDNLLQDTFSLLLDYKNPFRQQKVKKVSVRKSITKSEKKKDTPKTKAKIEKKIQFPSVKYLGFVQLKSDVKAAVVNINGNVENWSLGKIMNDMTLLDVEVDSIVIQKEGVRKSVLRN